MYFHCYRQVFSNIKSESDISRTVFIEMQEELFDKAWLASCGHAMKMDTKAVATVWAVHLVRRDSCDQQALCNH